MSDHEDNFTPGRRPPPQRKPAHHREGSEGQLPDNLHAALHEEESALQETPSNIRLPSRPPPSRVPALHKKGSERSLHRRNSESPEPDSHMSDSLRLALDENDGALQEPPSNITEHKPAEFHRLHPRANLRRGQHPSGHLGSQGDNAPRYVAGADEEDFASTQHYRGRGDRSGQTFFRDSTSTNATARPVSASGRADVVSSLSTDFRPPADRYPAPPSPTIPASKKSTSSSVFDALKRGPRKVGSMFRLRGDDKK